MKKNLAVNYFYNLFYQIFNIIIPFITTPYLSRTLGADGVGVYSYTLSIVSYFVLFAALGTTTYGCREISMDMDNKEKYSKKFWEIFAMKCITGVISLGCFSFVIFFSDKYNIIYLILASNIIASILDISWFYQGIENYKIISIVNMIIKFISIILIFLFVKESSDVVLYIVFYSLSLLLSNLLLWVSLFKNINKVPIKDLNIKRHFKQIIVYFLPQIAIQIYTVLDKTMLGIITGNQAQNGYYELSYNIIYVSIVVATAINGVLLPRMSYLYKNKKNDELEEKINFGIKMAMFLAFPMTIGTAAVSHGFVDWFFGSNYDYVKNLIVFFTPIIIIITLSNAIGNLYLTPCGKKKESAYALFTGAFVNFTLNAIFIPKYGCFGAAIGSIVAELVVTSIYFYLSRSHIKISKVFKLSYKYLIASLVMGMGVYFISTLLNVSIFSTLIEVVVGGIIYLIVLFLFKDSIWDLVKDLKSIVSEKKKIENEKDKIK